MRPRISLRRLLGLRGPSYEQLAKIILGLGNPGRSYAWTRHNVGRLALERLAAREDLRLRAGDGDFDAARWRRGGGDVLLARPSTWMNLSGRAAGRLSELSGLPPSCFLVLVDDMELPLGRLRLRGRGGSGGHRGLASLIERWGDDSFPRLRLGIGRPGGEVTEHVLSPFPEEELDTVEKMLDAAADAVCMYLDHGLERAMEHFNSLQIT